MSANVQQFVVHQICLSEEGKLNLVPRASCFEVNSTVSELAGQLHANFNSKPSKGVGGFDHLSDPTFKQLLNDYLSQQNTFLAFSQSASEKLLQCIVDESMLETGYVIFSHYEYLATEYLMISMLNTKQSVTVNSDLELSENAFLEPTKMQIAVRIDLTQLEVDESSLRYISFIKGRMGRKISDFFMNFIGCEEKIDVKAQNKQLVQEVDNYIGSQALDPTEKQQHRESVSNYYKEKIQAGEDLVISELDEVLPIHKNKHQRFSDHNADLEQPLEPRFQGDKTMLTAINKYSGAGGGVNISFERKLLGDRIQYDVNSDTLSIVGIPPNLKDQLLKAKSASDTSVEE